MNKFKIKVNNEESRIIQATLFNLGYTWVDGDIAILDNINYLIFTVVNDRYYSLFYVTDKKRFDAEDLPEITIDEFREMFGSDVVQMPLSRNYFKSKGFQEFPHITVGNSLFYELSRNRIIVIGSPETPNEMLFISQLNDKKGIDDSVCIHNCDYNGYLTEDKLNSLLKFFS